MRNTISKAISFSLAIMMCLLLVFGYGSSFCVHAANNNDIQNAPDDGAGQIHFAALKAFTHAYNGKATLEDTAIFAEEGDYSFNWYETDRNYDITEVAPQVVSTESTNKIQFPELEFYNTKTNIDPSKVKYYIPNGQSKVYFYVITEVDAGTTKDHVTNSTGDIKIKLTVANNGGTLSYTVDSVTTLGDMSVYRTNKHVRC